MFVFNLSLWEWAEDGDGILRELSFHSESLLPVALMFSSFHLLTWNLPMTSMALNPLFFKLFFFNFKEFLILMKFSQIVYTQSGYF